MATERMALTAPERLYITDNEGTVTCGCDQEWYGLPWQRLAGCGPTVATNLLLYLARAEVILLPLPVGGRHDARRLMDLVWRSVTPTMHGVNKTSQFCGGLAHFCETHHLPLVCEGLDVPRKEAARPTLAQVLAFVSDALADDSPVAFLNLHNGKVENLDDWHWITIVALETEGSDARVTVYDNGVELTIDLALWLATTTLGGGFARLRRAERG